MPPPDISRSPAGSSRKHRSRAQQEDIPGVTIMIFYRACATNFEDCTTHNGSEVASDESTDAPKTQGFGGTRRVLVRKAVLQIFLFLRLLSNSRKFLQLEEFRSEITPLQEYCSEISTPLPLRSTRN